MKKVILLSLTALIFTACSSTPTINGAKYEKDEVLSTSGDKSIPEWAELGEVQPVRFDHGKVFSVGITQIRGSERPDAGARVATNNAYANIANHVESRTEFILQNSEENFGNDSTSAKFIGSQVSSITSHEFTNEGTWWKRFAQSDEDGSRHIYYKIYSVVTLPESSLKAAVFTAIHKGESNHQLSKNFENQVSAQWNRFVENKTEPHVETHKPASVDTTPGTQDKKSE